MPSPAIRDEFLTLVRKSGIRRRGPAQRLQSDLEKKRPAARAQRCRRLAVRRGLLTQVRLINCSSAVGGRLQIAEQIQASRAPG